jgi:peptidoglycan/LPS O-acetylase OafA/YrhL
LKTSVAPKSPLQHLPELDSLRTVAVLMTLLAHFSPIEIPYMWYGVPIFFTISGFLVTTILLNTMKFRSSESKATIFKNFMIRRVLRLFPIYYVFIIFFWLAKNYLGLYLWKDEFTPYFFTYTPNFLIYQIGSENTGCFAHLWSLGVEEQFYLFWPLIVLFTADRYKMLMIAIMISISLAYNFINFTNTRRGAMPFAHFHTLGVGAVLACYYVMQGAVINWLKKYRHAIFSFTFIHLILVLIFFKDSSPYWHLYREVSLCICTFSIVTVSIFGWGGLVGYFTRNKYVQYIGTISYGIYLFHMPVPFLLRSIGKKYFPVSQLPPVLFLFICLIITFSLAVLSYKFIERPFLKLKQYFV